MLFCKKRTPFKEKPYQSFNFLTPKQFNCHRLILTNEIKDVTEKLKYIQLSAIAYIYSLLQSKCMH